MFDVVIYEFSKIFNSDGRFISRNEDIMRLGGCRLLHVKRRALLIISFIFINWLLNVSISMFTSSLLIRREKGHIASPCVYMYNIALF